MNRLVVAALAISGLAAAGLLFAQEPASQVAYRDRAGQAPKVEPVRPAARALAPVAAEPTGNAVVRPMLVANCRVRLQHEVQIPAKTAGTISEILAKEGDAVQKGQVLARLDDRIAATELAKAKKLADNDAPVELARKRAEVALNEKITTKELYEKRGTSKEEFLRKNAEWEGSEISVVNEERKQLVAKDDLAKAAAEVERHVIRAPFDGRVQQKTKQSGEAVQALETVFHVVRTDVVKLEGEVDQSYAARLKPGQTVEVWPDPTTKHVQTYSHNTPVRAVRVLPDGMRFAYAGDDGGVTVWNRRTDVRDKVLAVSAKPLHCLATCPSRPNELVAGGEDGLLYVINLAGGEPKQLRSSETADSPILAAVRDPRDPDRCYTGHADGRMRAWSLKAGEVVHTFSGHINQVTTLATAADRPLLLSADDQEVRLWNAKTGEGLAPFRGRVSPPKNEVRQLNLAPTGDEFLFNSEGLLQVRRLPDGLPVAEFESGSGAFSHLALFTPTPGLVLTAGPDGSLQLWRRPSASPRRPARLARVYARHNQAEAITQVDFTPDGRYFFSASTDRTVRMWAIPTLEELEAERLPAVVTFVSPVGDRTSERTVSFHAEARNPAGRLLANTMATVVVYPEP